MPKNSDFTKREKSKESQAKSEIISKLFVTWARIVSKYGGNELVYADLFAGSGYHQRGDENAPLQKGTALMTMDAIVAIESLHSRIRMLLNDVDRRSADALRDAINGIQSSKSLMMADVANFQVRSALYEQFLKKSENLPTFWFLDPTGWEGLSLDGIVQLTARKYNDLVFFFSYENTNRFITEAKVQGSLQELFGAEALQHILDNIGQAENPRMRERLIVSTLRTTLRSKGRLSECMKFGRPGSEGTSHFLIFVTKDYTGRRVFLDIAKSASNWSQFGVPISGYSTSRSTLQPSLFAEQGFEDEIDQSLLTQFGARTLTVKRLVESFFDPAMSLHRSFLIQSLVRLQTAGRVSISYKAKDGREQQGVKRLNDSCVVTFPESENGNGSRIND